RGPGGLASARPPRRPNSPTHRQDGPAGRANRRYCRTTSRAPPASARRTSVVASVLGDIVRVRDHGPPVARLPAAPACAQRPPADEPQEQPRRGDDRYVPENEE